MATSTAACRFQSLFTLVLLLTASSPFAWQDRKLNAPLADGGDVHDFQLSPDGIHVVYRADQDTNDRKDLYLTRSDRPATPVRLNPPLATGRNVEEYAFAPGGARVVYRADLFGSNVFELFSTRIASPEVAIRLNPLLAQGGDVTSIFAISADGSRVVYLADAETDGVLAAYSAAIDGSSPPVKLSGSLLPLFSSVARQKPQISADSERAVFLAGDGELYSAPLDGSAPPFELSAGGAVQYFELDALGERAVYSGPTNEGVFSVPLDGSALPTRLNQGTISYPADPSVFRLTPDGTRVVYRGDPAFSGEELFSAPLDASAAPTSIGGPPVPDRAFLSYEISPDSSLVAYVVSSPAGYQVFGAPLDGSAPPVELNPDGAQGNTPFAISPRGNRVLFLGFGWTTLFSVPPDGSEAPLPLSPPGLGMIDTTRWVELFDGGRRVVFVTTAGYLFEGPIDGSSQAREVHPPLTTGGAVLSFAARGRVVVYLADQDTDTVRELYVSVVTRPRFAPR